MKNKGMSLLISLMIASMFTAMSQDNTQLAIDILKAQQINVDKLTGNSWTRSAKALMNGEEKVHNLVKVWFNDNGEMESSVLSSESNVKKKRGIRGSIQKNAVEDLLGILEKTINLSLNYAFLSKGNWIDLLDMAEVKSGKISF